jgi:hypothetical protein
MALASNNKSKLLKVVQGLSKLNGWMPLYVNFVQVVKLFQINLYTIYLDPLKMYSNELFQTFKGFINVIVNVFFSFFLSFSHFYFVVFHAILQKWLPKLMHS